MIFIAPGLLGGADPESMPFPSQGLILDMVSDNLLSYPKSRGFLIDGFPRELEQAKEFERIVSDQIPQSQSVLQCVCYVSGGFRPPSPYSA